MTRALATMTTDVSGPSAFLLLKVPMMLTLEPGVTLPATPVEASIMMAISCSPAWSFGLSTNMSLWSSEPFFRAVSASLSLSAPRSVTAVADSHRFGSVTCSNWPAVRGCTGLCRP